MLVVAYPEPEFLKILKCDLAESASTGFQFTVIVDIFNDKILNYRHLDHFLLGLLNSQKRIFYIINKNCSL